jgi:hypothetical protein
MIARKTGKLFLSHPSGVSRWKSRTASLPCVKVNITIFLSRVRAAHLSSVLKLPFAALRLSTFLLQAGKVIDEFICRNKSANEMQPRGTASILFMVWIDILRRLNRGTAYRLRS